MTTPSPAARCCAGFYELPATRLLLGDAFHPGGPALSCSLARSALVHRASSVLDVAAGAGGTARLLEREFACRTTTLDLSPANCAASGTGRAVCGVAGALPFRAGRFDVVFCECALCTFDDAPGALDEMARVLKPGGRVAISDVTLSRAIPEELDTVFGRALCVASARPVGGYRRLLGEAGFTAVRVRDESWALREILDRIDARRERLAGLVEAGALSSRLGIEDGAVTLNAARAFVESGGISYTTFVARTARS